jgi:hypothetical protein
VGFRLRPNVLSAAERATLIVELGRLQHPDGGWSLTDLGSWTRVDKSPAPTGSDGYGTAFTVLVREETNSSFLNNRSCRCW